jgi:phosphoribosyl 1,2-cyclic phosphodiesterase
LRLTLWGTRGSVAAAGPETVRYGGNTSCVEARAADGSVLVLDAGTGVRRLGAALRGEARRIDVLLTHLHMDHIQGLGFFGPLFEPDIEVHVWGPPSATLDLRGRLTRYFSPPLFPVRLRDLPSRVELHNAPERPTAIGGLRVTSATVIHPGPTVGYRIEEDGTSLAYLPDHEPALGPIGLPDDPAWISGFELAAGASLLVHDAQYFPNERATRVGWGHSSTKEVAAFARLVHARRVVCFHHDPAHDDATIDRLVTEVGDAAPGIPVSGAHEGETLEV